MDGISDKANELAKASSDPRLTQNMADMTRRYEQLGQRSTVSAFLCQLRYSARALYLGQSFYLNVLMLLFCLSA